MMTVSPEKAIKALNAYRNGSNVERIHTRLTIKPNTVGHHTCNAMAIAVILRNMDNGRSTFIRMDRVLMKLLTHDSPEYYTGDTPGNVKTQELYNLVGKMEDEWYEEKFGYTELNPIRSEGLNDSEWNLYKAADALDLMWQCVQELEMGNRHINDVFDNVSNILFSEPLASVPGVRDLVTHLNDRWLRLWKRY